MEPGIWSIFGGIIVFYGILIALNVLMWQSMRSLRGEMNHRFDRIHDSNMNLLNVLTGVRAELAKLRG